MNLIPKPKFDLFNDLQNEINTVFSRFAPGLWRENTDVNFWDTTGPFAPTVDVNETAETIQVRAEIPGMEKDQISIDVQGNSLILSGEKKHEAEKKEQNVHWKECSYGKFTRQIVLPAEVDTTNATAEYKNGVLDITLPKTANATRKRIEVKMN